MSIRTDDLALIKLLLPETAQVWNLVDYHERYLLWYHGCYHGPTFRRELEDAIQSSTDVLHIDDLNLQWLALLFSIMSGSLACAPNAMLKSWGFWEEEVANLSSQWYRAAMSCLILASYTSDHQLYAVHAITTLSMSAHTLGLSEDFSVLLASALRIARSLGIDRVQYDAALENVDASSPGDQRARVLRREIARRLWSQLCIQDWLAIPFRRSHTISLIDYSTSKPGNRDHLTMESLPETTPTYISYGNYLFEIARLIAEHHTAVAQCSTPLTKYQKVLEYDARMKDLARKHLPVYFHVTAPLDPSWPEFMPWARKSLTICFAHKVLMIHRDFLRQSFTNSAFQVTRATCIAAAKTILKETRPHADGCGPTIWIDQAFCVTAGITLCLDVLFTRQDDPQHQLHVDLVRDCIDMLRRYQGSVIARRGAVMLSALLSERSRLGSPLTMRKHRSRYASLEDDAFTLPRSMALDIDSILAQLSDLSDSQVQALPGSSSNMPEFSRKQYPEIFPPQAGFSSRFLFEDLLRFDSNDYEHERIVV